MEESKEKDKERKRKALTVLKDEQNKKLKTDKASSGFASAEISEKSSPSDSLIDQTEINESSNEALIVDCDSLSNSSSQAFLVDDLANRRRKHPTRGSKRGRPRGSRRGGNRGGLNRSETITKTNVLSTSLDSAEIPSYESVSNVTAVNRIRRGPGRPRLKANGPSNQGNRHQVQKYRKPIAPLVVPLGSSPAPTPTARSPAMSPVPSPSPSLN